MLVSWLMQAFWTDAPYVHLNLIGLEGSAKSITQTILKSIVDPSHLMLRRPPKDEGDLIIAVKNERILSFDNLSGMPYHLSDAFCGLSTGVAIGKRMLYTDSEESYLRAKRPCMMNGIDDLTNRGDLIDRLIVIELPEIKREDRRREPEILERLRKVKAGILGLILDATVTGLRTEPEIDDLPRMADFCTWVMACEPSLPWDEGKFLDAYRGQIKDALAIVTDLTSLGMPSRILLKVMILVLLAQQASFWKN